MPKAEREPFPVPLQFPQDLDTRMYWQAACPQG